MLKVFIGLLTVGYPFLVYFAIDAVQPRYLALLLTVFFLLRWLQQGHGGKGAGVGPAILVPASVLYLLTVGFTNDEHLLLLYPVLVSALFFAVFFYSLLYPPSMAEKFARLREPDLPPRGVAYTRKVTQAWCAFFILNGLAAAATVWLGDRWLWSLYNGFIAYVLMGILMGTELLIRRKVKKAF